jgi:hypothetical protein
VGAGVQKHDVSFLGLIEKVEQITDFDSFGGWVVVGVVAEVEA